MSKSSLAFVDAFLLSLNPSQLHRLRKILKRGGDISDDELLLLPALEPLLRCTSGHKGLKKNALKVLKVRLKAIFDNKQITDDIFENALNGKYEKAIELIKNRGGVFISITEGIDTAQKISAAFPEHLVAENLFLGLLSIVNALKSGDLAKADSLVAILSEKFDLPPLESCDAKHDTEMICVLFMKAVYSDQPISDAALDRLFSTLSDLPTDASLMRGVLYNVGLDVLLRRNQIAMADEAANRALFHYGAAGETGLEFYIQLYLAIIAIWQGDLDIAAKQLSAADASIAIFAGATPNDELLLNSFKLICTYETGQPQEFLHHLIGKEDNIPFGEIWPAMAEPILSYGRRALASEATASAALSWVQRWRVRQWRSKRFDTLISVQEVLALQDLGRWQEADEILAGITGEDGIEVQIARFASALDRVPSSEELGRKLREAIQISNQSVRQRLTLTFMAIESALNRGTEREAVRLLGAAVTEANPSVLPKFWNEQCPRLERIFRNRSLRDELQRLPKLRRMLEGVMDARSDQTPDVLTRQEFRVLLLLAETQPNKMIAQRLGISVPTVKFHVSNLCKKSNVRNRKDVVQHALSMGWLPNQ